ncbi:NUDIX domain-containing protein [Paractinoplanes toevensis]|uniref:Uncharacterized protein n=1 Tax=Paractinoplanes toevensis TaxID=571911 RepID=A0A919TE77_9ACTN|nr:NUDIX domain-containing protein [Actinoplanes toevensis]GIM93808.1 hypothetical protein Ato02nite_056010 [Actinoplanes toevensis]
MSDGQVAAAVVVDDGKVLLIRRAVAEGRLSWQFPAGKVEPGESGEQAAAREAFEETGLVLRSVGSLGERVHPDTGRVMIYVAFECLSRCRVKVGTPALVGLHLRQKLILTAAVDDGLIGKNPCAAKSVTAPVPVSPKIVPWTMPVVASARAGLRPHYRPIVDVGAGCGARLGEIFGLSSEDFDFDSGWLTIRRQVKRVGSRMVFGLPKNDKERQVPLPESVSEAVQGHLAAFPPAPVTLPWEDPKLGDPVTVPLVFTTTLRTVLRQHVFAATAWHPAPRGAGVEVRRSNGLHALRHFYASVLLDAGENIKAVAEWLGHADAAFTLRVYAHLMPESPGRARRALDGLFRGPDGFDGPATAQRVRRSTDGQVTSGW